MITLPEFLLARIAEDEAVAHAAEPPPWTAEPVFPDDPDIAPDERVVISVADSDRPTVVAGGHDGQLDVPDATHIARWDPARVLAECSAKRAILAVHEATLTAHSEYDDGLRDTADTVLLLLAGTYSDHPDFHPLWRP